ncbi:MAG: hypothetical protein IT376_16255 [Polyangiaceae bacterium]|nr:hypothetical protein [Polyangiaceae bacterium]
MAGARARLGAALLAPALAVAACQGERAAPGPAASASVAAVASVSAAGPAPSASAAASAHPLAGEWRGDYEAKLHRIEMSPKLSGLKAWSQDDGARGSGSGSLAVSVAADGTATGETSGPLGAAKLAGAVEGEGELRLTLRPPAPAASTFSGTLLLELRGESLEGTLHASTGDSLVVRGGTAKLGRAKAP